VLYRVVEQGGSQPASQPAVAETDNENFARTQLTRSRDCGSEFFFRLTLRGGK